MGIKLPHLNAEGMVKLAQLRERKRAELNLVLIASASPIAYAWGTMPKPDA